MESQHLREKFESEVGESMNGIAINGLHLKYIEWLEEQLKNCSLQSVSNNEVAICEHPYFSVYQSDTECYCEICGNDLTGAN